MNFNPMKNFLMVAIFLCGIEHAFAQEKPNPDFELYILLGQSNMAGRGVITPEFEKEGHPRVFMLTKDKTWVLAKHPLHFDKPKAAGVGPGLTFGMDMAAENANVKIGLVPCAVGGTPIEHWKPGAVDEATETHPYDDALLRIKAAMQSGVIKGVIWHQGEGNSSEKEAKLYLKQLKALVKRVRKEVGNPKLPFVVGELGRYRKTYSLINTELAKVPSLIPFSGLATSEDLVDKGDGTHFDGPSATTLGHRFAKKMLELQGRK
jgi:hypothetical protein